MKFEVEIRKKDMDIVKGIARDLQAEDEWDFDKREVVKRKYIEEFTYKEAMRECFMYLFHEHGGGYGDQRKNIKVKRIE